MQKKKFQFLYKTELEIFYILTPIALMSLSCPPKVCLHAPSLMSHSLAVKSHAPEMKNLKSGDTARDMQSPWCPAKTVFWVPVSMSHSTLKETNTIFISVLTTEISGSCSILFSSINHIIFLPSAVAGAGDDLTVTKETTAGQVTWATKEILYEQP